MTPAIFLLLVVIAFIPIGVMTYLTCRNISAASEDAQEIIRNRAETRRNYARAQEDR